MIQILESGLGGGGGGSSGCPSSEAVLLSKYIL